MIKTWLLPCVLATWACQGAGLNEQTQAATDATPTGANLDASTSTPRPSLAFDSDSESPNVPPSSAPSNPTPNPAPADDPNDVAPQASPGALLDAGTAQPSVRPTSSAEADAPEPPPRPTSSAEAGAPEPPSRPAPSPEEAGTSQPGEKPTQLDGSIPTSCDPREVRCRRATPECPAGQVPQIVDACYGECVPIDECVCREADACPNPDEFTCITSRQHCSYYLR